MKLPSAKWCWSVAGTVIAATIFIGVVAQIGHYSHAEDTEERSLENEQRNVEQDAALAPIKELVEELGQRHADTDAGLEQDKMRCLQCKIKDVDICGAAGVEVCK